MLSAVSEAAKTLLSIAALIAVRMTVPPIPVVPLRPIVLPVVLNICPVLFSQIAPVGVIFAVVPIMVITVVPVVDSNLHAGFLRSGSGHDCRRCGDSRSQQQGTDVAIDMMHEIVLQIRDAYVQNPGWHYYVPLAMRYLFPTAHI